MFCESVRSSRLKYLVVVSIVVMSHPIMCDLHSSNIMSKMIEAFHDEEKGSFVQNLGRALGLDGV